MERRIYIETSIPSFYHEERPQPENVARRNWTREWWDGQRQRYASVTSVAVLRELARTPEPRRSTLVALVAGLPLVPINAEVAEIVEVYVRRHVMPQDSAGDALHLALASYHRCDYLLTWNCRHLANASKFDHIRRVNALLGLWIPELVTPVQLIEQGDDDEA